jgi:peptide chain release factor 1
MTRKVHPRNMSRLPLAHILNQLDVLNQQLATTTETQELIKLSKKLKKVQTQADLAKHILELEKRILENTEMLKELHDGDEMLEMGKAEIEEDTAILAHTETELLTYLAPADPRDESDIYLEIRAGAGGDEASIFVGDVLRMYTYLVQQIGCTLKVTSTSENPAGGYKEVIMEIKGDSPFSWFKYEGGVHRVQRVPATEKQGRIHTSTISIAIMPIVDKDNDFKLNMDEVEIEITMSGGKGGQSVNTTYSAVKMIHKPTKIFAQSQDERSQIQNREKCIQVLTSRVYNHYEEIRLAEEASERLSQVGKADRSEKIRTYNYPQDRITDHRYNLNYSNLPSFMDGGVYEMLKEIQKLEAENALAQIGKE